MNHLLIVDDEIDLAQGLASYIEDDNLKVTVCHNAIDGLEKLKLHNFECIVSDFSMPRMNGLEFLKSVREMKLEVPFIIYTGHGSDEFAFEASKFGCFEFVEKPLMTGLLDAIKRAIHQSNRLKESNYEDASLKELNDLMNELKGE